MAWFLLITVMGIQGEEFPLIAQMRVPFPTEEACRASADSFPDMPVKLSDEVAVFAWSCVSADDPRF
jgi:hypothetical protein